MPAASIEACGVARSAVGVACASRSAAAGRSPAAAREQQRVTASAATASAGSGVASPTWWRWDSPPRASNSALTASAATAIAAKRRRIAHMVATRSHVARALSGRLLERPLEQGREHDLGLRAGHAGVVADPLERLLEVGGVPRAHAQDRARLARDGVGGLDLGVALDGLADLGGRPSAPRRRARRTRASPTRSGRGRRPRCSRARRPTASSRSTRRLTAGADSETRSPMLWKERRASCRSSATICRSMSSIHGIDATLRNECALERAHSTAQS